MAECNSVHEQLRRLILDPKHLGCRMIRLSLELVCKLRTELRAIPDIEKVAGESLSGWLFRRLDAGPLPDYLPLSGWRYQFDGIWLVADHTLSFGEAVVEMPVLLSLNLKEFVDG